MTTIEKCISIFQKEHVHEKRGDMLFELLFKELYPDYKIPNDEDLLKYGKKLGLRKLKLTKDLNSSLFTFTVYVSQGCNGDWTDKYEFNSFLFFWKVIVPNRRELDLNII